jgi:hypothetical protein
MGWLNPFHVEHVKLQTELEQSTCIEIVRRDFQRFPEPQELLLRVFPVRSVRGKSRARFKLQFYDAPIHVAPVIRGVLLGRAGGTEVQLRLGLAWFDWVLKGVFASILALLWESLTVEVVAHLTNEATNLGAIGIAIYTLLLTAITVVPVLGYLDVRKRGVE